MVSSYYFNCFQWLQISLDLWVQSGGGTSTLSRAAQTQLRLLPTLEGSIRLYGLQMISNDWSLSGRNRVVRLGIRDAILSLGIPQLLLMDLQWQRFFNGVLFCHEVKQHNLGLLFTFLSCMTHQSKSRKNMARNMRAGPALPLTCSAVQPGCTAPLAGRPSPKCFSRNLIQPNSPSLIKTPHDWCERSEL